jgi:hypothetical protein
MGGGKIVDKKTQELMERVERHALDAEELSGDIDDETVGLFIAAAYALGRDVNDLELAKKVKNQAARKKISQHTAYFKPMEDRVSSALDALRSKVMEYLMPSGEPGNVPTEEIREYGAKGVGVASVVPQPDYEYDIAVLAEHHPELLKPDTTAIKKLIKQGEMPKGVTPITKYTLRIG